MAYKIRPYRSGYRYTDHVGTTKAVALSPGDIVEIARDDAYAGFHGYGNPEQQEGLFVLARPHVVLSNLKYPDGRPLAPSGSDWLPMGPEDIAEFCADLDEPAASTAAAQPMSLGNRTIAILTHDDSTRLPRPWSRACSTAELVNLIEHFDREHAHTRPVRPAVEIDLSRIDTDDPVAVVDSLNGRMAFYAFTER